LLSLEEWDLRESLRQGCSNDEILALVRECVWAKQLGHLIGQQHFERPDRTMHQIGG